MYSDSEDLIIFITFFSVFKYKILLFDFINKLMSYQQYMNEVLFNFFNYFIQIYFDDILIYSKIHRKHIDYIHSVLKKFWKAGLQADIQKCEFHIQKTKFLELIFITEKFEINSEKIKAIKNWLTLNNLKLI